MLSIFTQPYPKDSDVKKKVFTAFIFGNFIFFFLFFFQPFGINSWELPNKTLVLAGYGGITFLIVLFNSLVIEYILKNWFRERNWKVWKEIVWALWHILLIGILNLLYTHWQTNFPLTISTFLAYQWIALIVGSIPVIGITFFNYNRLQRKNLEAALKITRTIEADPSMRKNEEHQQLVTLAGDNIKETLLLDPENLLYMEAADNYIEVTWQTNGQIQKKLLRNTMKNMEEQLLSVPFVFRCHRSYLVNLKQVIKVSGNSQGYKLHLAGGDQLIPVSRSLNETIREKIEEIHPGKKKV
jgi:hypothetical protein